MWRRKETKRKLRASIFDIITSLIKKAWDLLWAVVDKVG